MQQTHYAAPTVLSKIGVGTACGRSSNGSKSSGFSAALSIESGSHQQVPAKTAVHYLGHLHDGVRCKSNQRTSLYCRAMAEFRYNYNNIFGPEDACKGPAALSVICATITG